MLVGLTGNTGGDGNDSTREFLLDAWSDRLMSPPQFFHEGDRKAFYDRVITRWDGLEVRVGTLLFFPS